MLLDYAITQLLCTRALHDYSIYSPKQNGQQIYICEHMSNVHVLYINNMHNTVVPSGTFLQPLQIRFCTYNSAHTWSQRLADVYVIFRTRYVVQGSWH